MSQADSSSSHSATSHEDDWASVRDPAERRKIQNRIAQRKFRETQRQKREDAERASENRHFAAGAYTTPDPRELHQGDVSGLPWGSISWSHIVAAGQAKAQAQSSAKDTSLYTATSRTGASSRVGLRLVDQYARGNPAWSAWQDQYLPRDQQSSTTRS